MAEQGTLNAKVRGSSPWRVMQKRQTGHTRPFLFTSFNLYRPGDLAVTTDLSDVLGESTKKRLGNPNLAAIIRNYSTFNLRGIAS